MTTYSTDKNTRFVLPAKFGKINLGRMVQLGSKWNGEKIGVVVSDRFRVESANERWASYDLDKGIWNWLTLSAGPRDRSNWFQPRRAQPYDIEPGMAFIEKRPKGKPGKPDDVTIYFNTFLCGGALPSDQDELDVCRDMIFADDIDGAISMAKKVIPHSYELFVLCTRREHMKLKEKTV